MDDMYWKHNFILLLSYNVTDFFVSELQSAATKIQFCYIIFLFVF